MNFKLFKNSNYEVKNTLGKSIGIAGLSAAATVIGLLLGYCVRA